MNRNLMLAKESRVTVKVLIVASLQKELSSIELHLDTVDSQLCTLKK